MTKVYSEKQILAEILLHFKERPCLWNPNHDQYTQRTAREKGFMELLEKYQLIDPSATIEQVKKKIDHMRCAYRRERRKVLSARNQGILHRPSLWYFDYLTFLNDDDTSTDSIKHETSVVTYLQENEDGEYEFEEVPKKRSKFEEILLMAPSSPARNSSDIIDSQSKEEEPEESMADLETESFGRTVGLQLRELEPKQRFIAEKLISEVIFYARLEQLKTESSICTD